MKQIQVLIDQRIKLVTAVLALSDWPQMEQQQLPHAVHGHAKQIRPFLQGHETERAVSLLNQALQDGTSLDDLFSAALRCQWPDFKINEPLPTPIQNDYPMALADFAKTTNLEESFWVEYADVWQNAVEQLTAVFDQSPLHTFLEQITGQPIPQITIMPTLLYPALTAVLATAQNSWLLLIPPPKAVGESPPWPYDEGSGWVITRICKRLLTHVLADVLTPLTAQQATTLIYAGIVLCLEQSLDEFEAQACLIRSKKEFNLPDLPNTVTALRDYLSQSNPQPLHQFVQTHF